MGRPEKHARAHARATFSLLLTWAPVSRTQMNLSDSIVVLVKVTNWGSTPSVVSCRGWEGAEGGALVKT